MTVGAELQLYPYNQLRPEAHPGEVRCLAGTPQRAGEDAWDGKARVTPTKI